MKKLLLILIVCCSLSGYGQVSIEKKDIIGEWFVSDLDSNFYNEDTLVFVKSTNLSKFSPEHNKVYIEPMDELTGTFHGIYFTFNKNTSVIYSQPDNSFEPCGMVQNAHFTEWNLMGDTISIKSKSVDWQFKVVKTEIAEFEFRYAYSISPDAPKIYTTPKWYLLRIN